MIIDTLMMTAGEVDENRSQEMTTKIFKPLKVLSRKHNVALILVHHMGKSEKARPGQRMLGAVANHAWAEDSLYLSRSGIRDIRIDLESKTVPAATYRMSNVHNVWWTPQVEPWRADEEEPASGAETERVTSGRRRKTAKPNPILDLLRESSNGKMTTAQLATEMKVTRSTAHRNMTRMLERGLVTRTLMENGSNQWGLPE
jgi:hypothetical protein